MKKNEFLALKLLLTQFSMNEYDLFRACQMCKFYVSSFFARTFPRATIEEKLWIRVMFHTMVEFSCDQKKIKTILELQPFHLAIVYMVNILTFKITAKECTAMNF
jgi:hypothetical protein